MLNNTGALDGDGSMKIIKNILVGLGALLVLFVIAAFFLFGESTDFKEQNEEFVRDFTSQFSQSWEVSSVSALLTNDMLIQVNTPNGRQAMGVFRTLGRLKEITDMELNHYNADFNGITTGIFKFKADFENASAVVTVTVQERDHQVRVHGFHVDSINSRLGPREIET